MKMTAFLISRHRERGAVTLLVSLVMLVAMTLFAVAMSRSSLVEIRASSNAYRAKQAFETAEAGFNVALAYYNSGGVDQNGDGVADALFPADTDGDGNPNTTVIDGKVMEARFCTPGDDPATLCNPATDPAQVLIWARGRSDDQMAQHQVRQMVTFFSLLPNGPLVPLVSKTLSTLSGNFTIENPDSNKTIWTGDVIDGATGSFQTYIEFDAGHTGLEVSSTKSGSTYTLGPDILQGDTNLSDATPAEFFQNFFGTDKAGFAAKADYVLANCSGLSAIAGDSVITKPLAIYVTGDCSFGPGNIGTAANPVLLVANGHLSNNGSPDAYGVFYGDTANLNGGPHITGSILTGDVVSGLGTATLTYSSSVIGILEDSGGRAPVNGSWRDF